VGVAEAGTRRAEGQLFPSRVTPCLDPLALQVLKDATLYFSCSTPNLAMVIPAMDYIDTTFTTGLLKKEQLDPAIRAAVGLAKRTLNRYYSLTDASELYRIAMGTYTHPSAAPSPVDLVSPTVLHPRYKLEYFKQAGWTPEWVATAQNLVSNTFNTSYMTRRLPGDTSEDNSSDVEAVSLFNMSFELFQLTILMQDSTGTGNIFDDLPTLVKPMFSLSTNELDTYLSTGVENVSDALTWWHERCTIYPHLACMAIDYLTIPGMSVQYLLSH